MSEQNFDFKSLDLSKEPDQQKFDEEFGELSKEERDQVVDVAQEEAIGIDARQNYQEVAEQINSEDGKIPALSELLEYDPKERKKIVDSLILEFNIELDEKKNIRERLEQEARKKGITRESNLEYPPQFTQVLRSIYNQREADILAQQILERSGMIALKRQIFNSNPDIVFLLVRSAVPAGIAYKTYIEEMKTAAEQSKQDDLIQASEKIPAPKFLLADTHINKWEEDSLSFNKAVKRYKKKLQKFKYIRQTKDKNYQMRIGVFDERINTGKGLEKQTSAVARATIKNNMNAEVFSFDCPYGDWPNIPLPISSIPKSGDDLPKIKHDEDGEYIYGGGVHSKWKHLYEQQAIRLARIAGKLSLKHGLRGCGSLRKLMKSYNLT